MRHDRRFHPVKLTVAAAIADLSVPDFARRRHGVHLSPELGVCNWSSTSDDRLPEQLAARVAAEFAEFLVDVRDPARPSVIDTSNVGRTQNAGIQLAAGGLQGWACVSAAFSLASTASSN